jgi:hypothetical protein
VQGTGQATPAVTAEWRQRGMRSFERVMRERLPAWANERASQQRTNQRTTKPEVN